MADTLSGGGPAKTGRIPFPVSRSGEDLILAGLVLYVTVLTVVPLGRMLAEAFASGADGETLGILHDSWSGRATARAFTNTLHAAGAATVISTLLGGGLALVLTLFRLRWRTFLTLLAVLPLLIPSQIVALAWIELLGPGGLISWLTGQVRPGRTNPLYSAGGIAFVMGIEHAPLVFLAVRAGLAGLSNDLVEAARMSGARPFRIVTRILLPLCLPSALAGTALAFVSAIGNFGVPALLGIPGRFTMLTTLIYQRLNGFGPSVFPQVAALALILVLLAAIGLLVRGVLAARTAAPQQAGAVLKPFALGPWAWPVTLAVLALLTGISVLPLVALVGGSLVPAIGVTFSPEVLSLDHYRFAVFGSGAVRRAFVNSFVLALVTALVSAAVAIPFAWAGVVRKRPLARALSLLADAPYAVPGTVLAIGVIIVFLPPLPLLGVSIYGTLTIILVAYLARFLPLALRLVEASLETADPALEEAGRVAGAGVFRRLVFLVAPAAAPAAAAGGLLVFMTAFNELTVSALLWSTGNETLGVMVFTLQYEGNSPAAAALASTVVALTLVFAFAADRLGRNLPPGVLPWRA